MSKNLEFVIKDAMAFAISAVLYEIFDKIPKADGIVETTEDLYNKFLEINCSID